MRIAARILGLTLLLPFAASVGAGAVGGPPLEWRRLSSEPGAAPRVLALARIDGPLAVGSERGVRRFDGGGAGSAVEAVPSASVRREGVSELVFHDESLWVGARDGLFEMAPGGEVRPVPLGPGAGLREVRDLDALGNVLAVATAGGLHLRRGTGGWVRVPVPSGGAAHVACVGTTSEPRLAAWAAGGLWAIDLGSAPRAVRRPVPRLAAGMAPVALARSAEGGLLIVYRDALAHRGHEGAWELLRPTLPPGASLRRYAFAQAHHWLASDAGLLVASDLAGPWQRAAGPLGSRSVVALAGVGGALVAATEREVYRAFAPSAAPAGQLPAERPPLEALQRAVLRHQSLAPGDVQALRRGLALRGYLPELTVTGRYERSRSRGGDYDESIVSGAMHELHDRDYDRDRDYGVALTLRWDLGDIAYHPESIDLSRESRALVALRDDVLDEVNQLYFDRLRAGALRAALVPSDPERHVLDARIAEADAGLDAWTGGFWSRSLVQPPPGPASPRSTSH